ADVVRRAVGGAARVLVITEGLVVYLDDVTVRALARDLAAQVGIRWWVLDLLSPGIRAMISNGMGGRHPARALVKFAPENGVAFFEGLGWKAREVSPIFRAAARKIGDTSRAFHPSPSKNATPFSGANLTSARAGCRPPIPLLIIARIPGDSRSSTHHRIPTCAARSRARARTVRSSR